MFHNLEVFGGKLAKVVRRRLDEKSDCFTSKRPDHIENCNPNTGRQREVDPGGSMASHSNQWVSFAFSETLSQKLR